MIPKAAILIPTIAGRENFLKQLVDTLLLQMNFHKQTEGKFKGFENKGEGCSIGCTYKDQLAVEILILKDHRQITIGEKRNILTQIAVDCGASYRAFIDDDDLVASNYIELNAPGILGNYDCNSLTGIYSVNGLTDPNKHVFIHSLKYDHWHEDEKYFYRNPNHLNFIKLDLIKDIQFQHKNEGEDGCWSEELFKSQRLKNEYEITQPFYHYNFRTKLAGQP